MYLHNIVKNTIHSIFTHLLLYGAKYHNRFKLPSQKLSLMPLTIFCPPATSFPISPQLLINMEHQKVQLFNMLRKCQVKQADYSMVSACHTSINTSQDHVHTFNNCTRLLTPYSVHMFLLPLRTYIIIPFLVSAWFLFP